MPTGTIYTDSYMVVVDNNHYPSTAPWLRETTYLINSLGETTAMIAQTAPATYDITPVPWTVQGAAASPQSVIPTTTPTASATPTASPGSKDARNALIAIVISVVVSLLMILGAVIFCLVRRFRTRRPIETEVEVDEAVDDQRRITAALRKRRAAFSKPSSLSKANILARANSHSRANLVLQKGADIGRSFNNLSKLAAAAAPSHDSTLMGVSSNGSVTSLPRRKWQVKKKSPMPSRDASKYVLPSILKRSSATMTATNTDSIPTGSPTLQGSVPSPISNDKESGEVAKVNEDASPRKKSVTFGWNEIRVFGSTRASRSSASGDS